jgi:hypothetical protein
MIFEGFFKSCSPSFIKIILASKKLENFLRLVFVVFVVEFVVVVDVELRVVFVLTRSMLVDVGLFPFVLVERVVVVVPAVQVGEPLDARVNQGGQTLHRTVDQVGRDVANSFS